MTIPEELIGIILRFVVARPNGPQDLSAIVPCAQVSSSFRSEVERLLYGSIVLTRPDQIVKCFKTIVKRRDAVARFIRILSVELREYHTAFPPRSAGARSLFVFGRPSPGSGDDGRLLRGFANLVQNALHCMKNMQHYHLRIGRNSAAQNKYSEPFLLHAAPFSLRSFHCISMDASPALFRFLKSQPSIEEFYAPDMFPPHLPGNAILPYVKSVAGTPELLKRLVPKRPVSAVHCTGPLDSENLLHLLPKLALSTVPITALVVPVKARTACDILPSIARTLPNVELLSMPLPNAFIDRHDPYEVYQDETFARALGSFDSLKRVEVPTMDFLAVAPPSFNLPNLFNHPPPPFNVNGPIPPPGAGPPGEGLDNADATEGMIIDNVAVDVNVNVTVGVGEGNGPPNAGVGINEPVAHPPVPPPPQDNAGHVNIPVGTPTNPTPEAGPNAATPQLVQNGQGDGFGGLLGQVLNQVQALNQAMGQVVNQVNGILNGVAQGVAPGLGAAPHLAQQPEPMVPANPQPLPPPFMNPLQPPFVHNVQQLNTNGLNAPPVIDQPAIPANFINVGPGGAGGGAPPAFPNANFMNQFLGQILGAIGPGVNINGGLNAQGNGNVPNAGAGGVNFNIGNVPQPPPDAEDANDADLDNEDDPLPFPGGLPPFPGLQLPPLPAFIPGGPNAFTFNGPNFDAILQFTPAIGNQAAGNGEAAAPGGALGAGGAGLPPANPGGAAGGAPAAPPGVNLQVNPQVNIAHLVLTFPPVTTNAPNADGNDLNLPNGPSHTPTPLTAAQHEQAREAFRTREKKLADAQHARAPIEQMILQLWAAYCPTLVSVKFEMAKNRYVVWRREHNDTDAMVHDDGGDYVWSSEYTPMRALPDVTV